MKKLIEFIRSGCWHEWETIKEVRLERIYDEGTKDTGAKYILRCKKCGEVVKRDLIWINLKENAALVGFILNQIQTNQLVYAIFWTLLDHPKMVRTVAIGRVESMCAKSLLIWLPMKILIS